MNTFLERLMPYRRPMIVLAHACMVILAYGMAFLLRFDARLPAEEWDRFLNTLPLLLLVRLSVFGYFHLYKGLWRYVSMRDIVIILKAGTLGSLIFVMAVLLLFVPGFPRSVLVMEWILCLALVGGVRLGLRAVRESNGRIHHGSGKRILIIGAGDAGEMLIRDIERSQVLNYEVVGFVDDDLRKRHRRIHGVEVIGCVEELPRLCRDRNIQEILVAIPSATCEQRQRVYRLCGQSGVVFKTIPPLSELLQGKARISQVEEVKPEDLLGRRPVRLDVERLRQEIQGQRILVTGAGGSIGSELCRQLAAFEPEVIILLDRAESNLYFLEIGLKHSFPGIRVVSIVGDILDAWKLDEVMTAYAPDLVYHAAAYKHVPLMEAHPLEAIENNIFGTETVAVAAQEAGARKFVFISTDKAVKPIGIMGMTKRISECLLQSYNGGATTFVAVRFGNVLGSDGSVLPLFRWQIANGGPITVTDPEVTRYFMLISEAVQLVLQAGAMGQGREVFFLDMGEPVRILDLAENLIRLSGMRPGKDIPIEVIGLRPGERLREDLVMDGEALLASEHEKVFMVQNHQFDERAFQSELQTLRRIVAARDRQGAIAQLRAMAARY